MKTTFKNSTKLAGDDNSPFQKFYCLINCTITYIQEMQVSSTQYSTIKRKLYSSIHNYWYRLLHINMIHKTISTYISSSNLHFINYESYV